MTTDTTVHEEVITSESYYGSQKDSVIQLVQSKNGGSRYRVFDNKTGTLHLERFVRMFEAKRFVRAGFIQIT